MKVQTRFVCDGCHKPVEPNHGKIIQGNIYMVGEDCNEPTGSGGLIGTGENRGKVFEEIERYVYCDECLLKSLYIKTLHTA